MANVAFCVEELFSVDELYLIALYDADNISDIRGQIRKDLLSEAIERPLDDEDMEEKYPLIPDVSDMESLMEDTLVKLESITDEQYREIDLLQYISSPSEDEEVG